MPGTQTHLWAGREFLRSSQQIVSKENFGFFLMGTIFPDFGYWPGMDQKISDLAHYVGSLQLPKTIFAKAETAEWKAFALGWLLHVQLDIAGHPFVNRLAAKQIGSEKSEISYEDDPALHAKVEAGLDLALVNKFGSVNLMGVKFPDFSDNPVSKAYKLCYGFKLNNDELGRFSKIPKMISLLTCFQVYLGKHAGVRNILTKASAKFYPEQAGLIDSIFNPIKPNESVLAEYQEIVKTGINRFTSGNQPNWLEHNYNLDSGRLSRLGDYKLADKMFKFVDKRMVPKNIQSRYHKEAEKILRNWEKIRAEFESSRPNTARAGKVERSN